MTDVLQLGTAIPLVGRRDELAALTGALARAKGGQAGGVLLSGDAGIGKSRLVAELATQARADGFEVLVGRCLDSSAASLPYLPFTEVVGQLAADQPRAARRPSGAGAAAAGRAARRTGGRRSRARPAPRVRRDALGARLRCPAEVPALLVLEDLHWADRSSRDLLVFLLVPAHRAAARGARHLPHRRPAPAAPAAAGAAELVRLPAVERLDLAPLVPADTLDLVRALADGSLSEALAAPRRRAQRGQRVLRGGAGVGVVGTAAPSGSPRC